MRAAPSRFHELDDLVLRLKGLVLVRDIRKSGSADGVELQMYSTEIERVRDRIADLVKRSGEAERPAA
jgi:hypothetical protein